GVAAPASWTRGAQAQTALGGTARPVRRASGASAGQDGPRCGGQQARGLRWPTSFWQTVRLRQRGETSQTAFMERWYGTWRGLVAPLRRRPRCVSWIATRHRGRIWLLVSLYNFVMPPRSLRQGRPPRYPFSQ